MHRSRSQLVLALLLSVGSGASPIQARTTLPEQHPLDRVFDAYADSGFTGVVLVGRGDSVVFQRAGGAADVVTGRPLDLVTPMEIMSITKLFSALSVVMLYGDGRLDLDQPLGRYVEEFDVGSDAPTVHDLLMHTGGLPERGPDLDRSSPVAYATALAAATSTPPGNTVTYSNPGYGLIPILVERRTGVSYRAFLETRVFRPADMTRTSFTGSDDGAATGYRVTPDGLVPTPPPEPRVGVLGATGIVTTAEDLFRWFRALRQNRLLPDALTDTFLEEHLPGYGYSWVVDAGSTGARRMHKDGAWISFESQLAWYPDRDEVIIILSNQNRRIAGRLWHALERALASSE